MNAIILASGNGTRMKKLTEETPKSMLKIKGKPILEYTLENLPDKIDKIYIIVGYLKEQIKDYFGDNFLGKKIIYIETPKDYIKGTGAKLNLAKDHIKKSRFLVLMGDDLYSKKDLEKMLEESDWVILAKRVDNPENFGVLKFDENNNVIDIVEKPKKYISDFANAAAYIIDERFFNYPLFKLENGEYGLPQTIIKAVKDIPLKIVEASFWHSNNKASDLKKAEKLLKDKSIISNFEKN